MTRPPSILITGAGGQLGSVLYQRLVAAYGSDHVLATDIYAQEGFDRFELLDVTDRAGMDALVDKHGINQIYHMAAILSAHAEQNPQRAWEVNMSGLLNVLDIAGSAALDRVFYPSSIAVFGEHTDLSRVDQHAVQHPTTLYGISKSAGENWCQYYALQRGVDVRSLRYPGVIGPDALPGGGTTDYAVHIFHEALRSGTYNCYLSAETTLPMIYIDDALDATLQLMDADPADISIRTSYNIQATSFNPGELATAIKQFVPEFHITYDPDQRQAIADNWPRTLADEKARVDWGWAPKYPLDRMVSTMITQLTKEKIRG